MGTRKMPGVGIVFQEEGLVVGQMIVLSKDSPDTFAVCGLVVVPLMELYFGKFINQGLVDDEMLVAVGTR